MEPRRQLHKQTPRENFVSVQAALRIFPKLADIRLFI
jgi:hypothetical protein